MGGGSKGLQNLVVVAYEYGVYVTYFTFCFTYISTVYCWTYFTSFL